ncbi:AMP-binding protein, partial [Methylogaea oryzae]|uniref:AMP-binding protein n=1 Tax=Methylogaea oryzae TaxID=1295382 RepID=UPI000A4608E3
PGAAPVAGHKLTDIMVDMMFETSGYRRTLLSALLEARGIHGGKHEILEDVDRRPLTYDGLLRKAAVLGARLARESRPDEAVGLMVPNSLATVVSLMGLQMAGRVPAMLNYSAGAGVMLAACATAQINTVVTSRRFVEQAKRQDTAARLAQQVRLLYLEDLAQDIPLADQAHGLARLARLRWFHRERPEDADRPAVILFTSGSEGTPKGVVLSHANLMANREQLAAAIDFGAGDTILNAMPLFHSFGLTAGTLLPLLSGIKSFLYPTPLHYRIIPELAYDINATILFGTNTFLAATPSSPIPTIFIACATCSPGRKSCWRKPAKPGRPVSASVSWKATAPRKPRRA